MKYNYPLLLILFFVQPVLGMEKNNQVALQSDLHSTFAHEAQKDWKEETREILKQNKLSTQSVAVLNRYTQLFVERAKKQNKPGKSVAEIAEEVKNSFPTQSEFRTICARKATWGQWAYSWYSDPVRNMEWSRYLVHLEQRVAAEEDDRLYNSPEKTN